MKYAAKTKVGWLLVGLLMAVSCVQAQPSSEQSAFSSTEYQDYGKFYERVTYIGKRKDHYIVDTFSKDSILYRTDNYRVIDQGNYFGLFAVRHGPSKVLYNDGRLYLTCDYNMNVLNGPFIVYHADGSVKRRELYRNGKLKKSMCYDAEGNEQICEAFYQQLKFKGNPDELKAYFAKNLMSILTDTEVANISVKLIVNEIGQVIDTKVTAGRNNPRLVAAIRKVVQDMPMLRENETNWKPATMDGIPIPEAWVMYAYRDRSMLRITLP
ncbi:hypothetical protein A6C57_25120 [Fibrella sp. ES10-3-2-2]|nr:hypothetical protein A6C57_25120 [Fibrella sp. ES10-3-2-2]